MTRTPSNDAGAHTVFAWLLGQDDNVGDSVLRRGYADALRTRGPIVAYVGWNGPGYVAGLGLQPEDRVEHRYRSWLAAILRASSRGPVTVAINSGEFALSRLYALYASTLIPTLRLVHRRGGTVIWLGAAVPAAAPRPLRMLFSGLFRQADLVRWRDDATASIFEPAPWMPDWALAFEQRSSTQQQRRSLVVSLRSDREYPSPAWIEAIRGLASRLDLEIVAVAQVQRDDSTVARLVDDLSARAVTFSGGSHEAQESMLRDEYGRTSLVLSDRLHVLIVAATEGAVPLAWCPATTDKIGRHLRPLDMPFATVARDDQVRSLEALTAEAVERLRAETRAACAAASEAIVAITDEVRRAAPR